jgi:DNA mismatch repair ATPase MutS
VVCCCFGRGLWAQCFLRCWHRPQSSSQKHQYSSQKLPQHQQQYIQAQYSHGSHSSQAQQDSYEQIQALRQQLQELQKRMASEA